MYANEAITLEEARENINLLVQGVDPSTGEILDEAKFLNEPKIIRCFATVSDVLTRCIEGKNQYFKKEEFKLSKAVIEKIEFPEGEVGIMKLVHSINRVIDKNNMKKLSAFAFNKKLIEEGILSYSSDEGSKRAIVNDTSADYGIISIKATFNGEVYNKVIYTEQGKNFILENLLKWFS